jgi:hypothetical protein
MIARFIIALVTVCMVAPATNAGFVLRFGTSPTVLDSADFGVGSTGNVINLYLVADAQGKSDLLAKGGVGIANLGSPVAPFSAGVTLTGSGSIQTSNPNVDADPLKNAFDTGTGAVNGINAAAWTAEVNVGAQGVFGTDVGEQYFVTLGNFTVTAGNNFLDTGTLNLVAGEVHLFFNDQDVTEINVTSFGKFDFTAVPEPSAFLLMGMAVTGGAAFLRRRKTRVQPETPVQE